MTVGESIKKHRSACGFTQKDLSDKLNVSYQTVSKWENDINEPDLSTLKKMCELFSCSVDELLNGKVDENKTEPAPQVVVIAKPEETTKEETKPIESEVKEEPDPSTSNEDIKVEEKQKKSEPVAPFKKHRESKYKVVSDDTHKVFVWSIVIGAIALAITLTICIINFSKIGIGWTIGLPLIIGYTILADIYCIFTASWISDVFLAVSSWSIKFPGIIFSFSWDGLKFLIIMKLLFAVLGFLVGLATFLLAIGISSLFSIFTFPFLLIYNKKHDY